MAPTQELEKQINVALIILNTKVRALKATLTKEQIDVYHSFLENEKTNMKSVLDNLLTEQEVDEVLKVIDN